MPRYNIELSEDAARVIEAEVSAGRHASAQAYLEDLLREEQRRRDEQARFEQLVDEGIQSGPGIPVDEEFCAERRRKLEDSLTEAIG